MAYTGKNFATSGSNPAAFEAKTNGRLVQITKLDIGDADNETPVSSSNPLPVTSASGDIATTTLQAAGNLTLTDLLTALQNLDARISPILPSVGAVFAAVSVTGDTELLAADTARNGATIFNTHATNSLLVAYGFTSSTSNYSVKLVPGAYLEVPIWAVALQIKGIASSGTITANVTAGGF